MSNTANDLIADSLRLIGVLASGEAASAEMATDGLSSLNDMLDSWSNENLFIPNHVREVFTLTGKQTYTMGTGGDFDTSRPTGIDKVLIQLTTSTPALELPVNIVTESEYAMIRTKALSSTLPRVVYPDGAYPLLNLNLYPIPTQGNIVIYSAKPLANLSTLTTALSLPPGYRRLLRYSLAIELAPEYGKSPSQEIVAISDNSKAAIKRKNSKPRFLKCDGAIAARPSAWDWNTGEPR